jgi:RNA recognition motif-containing protein
LQQRLTNEELAVSLLSIFKPFGPVLSVKASRDHRGRPFGFVEYESTTAAASALAYAPYLTIDSRRIRVEPAKRQRKLCIKVRVNGDSPLELHLEATRAALQQYVTDESFKLSLQGSQDAEWALLGDAPTGENVIAAVVKFEDPDQARIAYEAWRTAHPEWTLTWINMDRSAFGSNVRNSGLVQLVPGDGGGYHVSRFSPPPFVFEGGIGLGGVISGSPMPVVPRYTPSYEEETVSDMEAESLSMESLTLDERDVSEWLGRTLFVGRLNSQQVTIPLLKEHFAKHGPIRYIRLFNRGAVGYDGVPLDAYAIIRFISSDSMLTALEREHGTAWLGQTMKCDYARTGALGAILNSGKMSPVPPVYPGFIYYPMMVPPPPGGKANSNWYRAKPTSEKSNSENSTSPSL